MLKRGPLCVALCYMIWGVLPVYWRAVAVVDSMYVLAARIVWSLVFLSIVLLATRKGNAVRAVFADKKELHRLMLAGAAVCVNWGSYIWAMGHGFGVDASLAYYMNPILAIFLGMVMFREQLTKLQWLAVAVAFTGIVVAVIRYRQFPWVALLIGGSFAVYSAIKKRVKTEAAVSLFFETLTLTPFALVAMVVMELNGDGALGVLQGVKLLLIPAVGIVSAVPLLFFAKGIRTTPMSLAGVLMYINPTMQLLICVLLYRDEFTTTHAILFAFVWSGLALYLLAGVLESRKQRKEQTKCE